MDPNDPFAILNFVGFPIGEVVEVPVFTSQRVVRYLASNPIDLEASAIKTGEQFVEGAFSLTSKAYESIPEAVRPAKDAVYKLLENPAYDLARKAANATNRAIGTAWTYRKTASRCMR